MASYQLPPWLQPQDPVGAYAQGLQIGTRIGSEQASQQLQQQQLLRQQQNDAIEQARQQAEFSLKSEEKARLYAAQKQYQDLVSGGMDPSQALLKVGPAMGSNIEGLLMHQTMSPYQQAQIDTRNKAIDESSIYREEELQRKLDESLAKMNETADSGPVQGQPVLDPTTQQPIPGLVATPSPGGKGMTVHLTPKAEAQLTPTTAANLLEKLPQLDAAMGTDPSKTNSLTSQLSSDLLDVVRKAVPQKKAKPVSPFKEGTLVRNKKTGKLFRIVGGQPVPVDESSDKSQATSHEEE